MPFKRLLPYAAIFLLVQTLIRLSLLARAVLDVKFEPENIIEVLARGLWMDVVAASFCLLPIALYHLALPAAKHGGRFDRAADKTMRFVFSFVLLFDAVAEHLFWSEFTTRFN